MPDELLTQSDVSPAGERKTSFQDALEDATPIAFVTPALIALNVLVFLAMCLRGVPFLQPNAQQVLPWGANFGPLTVGDGQWWRLLTACFLHFGIMHIAVNMYILWQVGPFTERLFGNLRYAVLYLVAGIGGNIAGLFWHNFGVGAGASGAIFGVYGGLLGFLLIERGVVPGKAASGIAKSAGLFVLYNLVAGFARPETDQVAHIGGIVTGFLAGCALARPLGVGRRHLQPARALVVTAVAAALGVLALRHLPAQSAGQTAWYRQIMTGKTITVGHNDRVVYSGTATQADAQRLAQVLERVGFLHGNVVVLLDRNAAGATLSIPLREDATPAAGNPAAAAKPADGSSVKVRAPDPAAMLPWNNPSTLVSFEVLGPEMASAAGGPPLAIRLLNSKGEPQRTLVVKAGQVVVGTRDRVVYSGATTGEQATQLGAALVSEGFLHDRGAIVVLGRESKAAPVELALFTVDGAWDDPKVMSGLQDLVRKVAPTVGGLPVIVHVLDSKGQMRKQITVQ